MFNRYFEAGEDSVEFLFAHLAVKNIDFAKISLSCILEPHCIDYALYQDEHTYFFFHIQSVLTACGNLYNIFYGNGMWMRHHNNDINRPSLLRKTFDINKSKFPLVFDKSVRNTNEHLDERFDEFRWNIGDYNILNRNTPPDMRATILNENHLRTFDRSNNCYYTYIRRDGRFIPKVVDLQELLEQLFRMRTQITTHPIFESRWVDRMPGDILNG